MVSGTHSICTHFPKDICLRTKITGAPCRRTADHKVLSDGCESRHNHQYAVVVQDLATKWIQSYRCKTKTSQETEETLQKFLEPTRKPKVIYTDNSQEFGKSCEDLSWNHGTSTPHRSETNGIAERAVRRMKEGTSAVLLQSGLDENGGRVPWNVTVICGTYKISCLMGRHLERSDSENHLKDQLFHLVQWSNITLFLLKTCRDCISSARKPYQVYSSVMFFFGDLERRHFGRRH